MILKIGIDDTDNIESRGTGHLARVIAQHLGRYVQVLGVTRHQLLFDPRVPYTAKNSCAAIIARTDDLPDPSDLFGLIKDVMVTDFQKGSDPGLCLALDVSVEVIQFGQRAKTELVSQKEARSLAAKHGLFLEGLGGTEDGVIGALAAVGLVSLGDDGRYIQVGEIRELSGMQSLETIKKAGIHKVMTLSGVELETGIILAEKLRPARRGGLPVLYVDPADDYWLPRKLD